jgi:hypothetical protein
LAVTFTSVYTIFEPSGEISGLPAHWNAYKSVSVIGRFAFAANTAAAIKVTAHRNVITFASAP